MLEFIHNIADWCRLVFDNFEPIFNDFGVIFCFVFVLLLFLGLLIFLFLIFLGFVLFRIDCLKEDLAEKKRK